MVRGPNNGSIYVARETLLLAKLFTNAKQEEDSPGKGFLWGILFKKNGAWYFLGVHSEKQIYPILLLFNSALPKYFLDMRKYLVRGPNNGSIYIARETFIYQCLQEEDSPGKGFLWGILYFIKRGLVILGLHSREK